MTILIVIVMVLTADFNLGNNLVMAIVMALGGILFVLFLSVRLNVTWGI